MTVSDIKHTAAHTLGISLGNILTLLTLGASVVWSFAENSKQIAMLEVKIENQQQIYRDGVVSQQSALREAILAEQNTRREGLHEIRVRLDADRAEIRQQLERLNNKLDELIKNGVKQ